MVYFISDLESSLPHLYIGMLCLLFCSSEFKKCLHILLPCLQKCLHLHRRPMSRPFGLEILGLLLYLTPLS